MSSLAPHSVVGVISDRAMDKQVWVLLEGLPTDGDAREAWERTRGSSCRERYRKGCPADDTGEQGNEELRVQGRLGAQEHRGHLIGPECGCQVAWWNQALQSLPLLLEPSHPGHLAPLGLSLVPFPIHSSLIPGQPSLVTVETAKLNNPGLRSDGCVEEERGWGHKRNHI